MPRKPKPAFDVIEIRSWDHFQAIVAGPKYRNWAFRGQEDASWPLFSSLSRYLRRQSVHTGAWAEQGARILTVFQAEGPFVPQPRSRRR